MNTVRQSTRLIATRTPPEGPDPDGDANEIPTLSGHDANVSPDVESGTAHGAEHMRVLSPSVATWLGVALSVAGFVAIFYAWARVAGLVNVAEQMPYVVSGGLTGLALVVIGSVVVDVSVRRGESDERQQQLLQLSRALSELRVLLDDRSRDREE